jgi:GTP-binding protein HflX
VVDASHSDPAAQLATVRDVIGEVNARDLPEIVAFNKSDLVDDDRKLVLRGLEPDGVFVSARTGEGIDELLTRIAAALPQPDVELELLVPYDRGDIVSLAHSRTKVVDTVYEETGTRLTLLTTQRVADQLRAAVLAHA